MRTETLNINVYSIEDVKNTPELKAKVLEKYHNFNVEYYNDWYECIFEGFKETLTPEQETEIKQGIEDGKIKHFANGGYYGFEVEKVFFSGFWSQGDGAMFEGRLDNINKLIDELKCDERVKKLIKAGKINIYNSYRHSGHYYHEKSYTSTFDFDFNSNYLCRSLRNIEAQLWSLEEQINDKYETLCRKMYRCLEAEHEYQTSEEAIIESLEANGYEFTIDGKIH